ncbi:type I restriction-modification system subunit M N-terminal domain-containing protein [Nocardia lijiangensis]|uniref:type I restriction-modification system subunit M N-terminal domain-containing protein n=1 Tax=Nocardia lijiangensis TaxID=299618 RepID=UPI003D75E783
MSATRISQRALEQYLWGAAVVLRGLIDAGDYKQYIFPLVFLKRISDAYDEEHAAAAAIYGDEELADLLENHRFAIPDGCHWDDIRSTTTGRKISPLSKPQHRNKSQTSGFTWTHTLGTTQSQRPRDPLDHRIIDQFRNFSD